MKAEQNELVTRIGPDTACGAVLRSYWQPVALVDEFDPRLDLGLYATIDHGESAGLPDAAASGIAHRETMQLLKEWGYVGARSSAH